MQYLDRRDAGRRLGSELLSYAQQQPVIVALPRGGVPVGVEVAHALGAPLEILAVRKIGAPGNPELAVGAVAEDGTGVLDPRSAGMLGMTQSMLDQTLALESEELRRRVARYREDRPALQLKGRLAIVVDDGMATGMTEMAAVHALRKLGAGGVIVAVPVGSRESIAMLEEEADRVVCLTVPNRLHGVGMWYGDFAPVSDEEVLALLATARGGAVSAPASEGASGAGGDDDGVSVEELTFHLDGVPLAASLIMPEGARGVVVFAHGTGSSRRSPRNRFVAETLARAKLASLLLDLLDPGEATRRDLTFDIPLLSERLARITGYARADSRIGTLPVGYYGASTGAAAALTAAATLGDEVAAVVSRGGRPDLAGEHLPAVLAPSLLIVGGADRDVLELNRQAAALLRCPHELVVIDGAGHLFEEPGALEQVAELAGAWFTSHLAR